MKGLYTPRQEFNLNYASELKPKWVLVEPGQLFLFLNESQFIRLSDLSFHDDPSVRTRSWRWELIKCYE